MAGALDVYRVPLVGLNLIEASAGTGKTWSLCGLYLRLLLEKDLDVRRILVVTFTNAATAELRARIRARISEALDILRARESALPEGPFDAELATYLDSLAATAGSTSLMRRLVLARESFDEAAIFTIHGFCQRALADTPFSGGLPFAFEALEDDEEYRLREAQDFWRRRIAQLDGACMAHLVDGGDTPASYAAYLGKCLAKPLAKVEWPPLPDVPVEPDFAGLAASFATLRAAWSAGDLEPPAVLEAALEILNGQSYKPASIAQGAREWRAWFATEDPLHLKHDVSKAKFPLYRTSKFKLKKGTRKGREAERPAHPFFDAAEAFLTLQASYLQALREKRLQLLREFLAAAGQALNARKKQERVVAFNDMLANLHDALDAGGNPGLAAALRERFPVALIDEFQDTDPLQFEIFRLIHGEENHLREFPVFLVGDPKQAIYSFRNADLRTYLMAASLVSARHVLGVNRRSTPALVESCNGLFGHNPEAFLQPGIAFMPAAADSRRHAPLHDESSASRACFEVWWLPGDAQGEWLALGAARALCAERTAAEIARLLAEQAQLQLDGRGLRASDIAVLVRTHAEGRLVRQALASRQISCVEMSPASVLRTLEAEELERVLMAIAHRGEGLLRAAMASNFMGGSAEAILALSADSQAFLALIQRFTGYRETWQTQGFAVMFRRFLREESVQAHTLTQADGERRLTNLLHLGELLGEASTRHAAPDALLRWFRSQRNQPGTPPEAAQMRLESDDRLVRIVTIHKSKGLEYPVVFCPFLWLGGRGARTDLPLLCEYHAEGRAVLDFGTPAAESDAVKVQRTRDADAEFMRLIYVALTRASRRCYLMAGLCRTGNESAPAASLRSHLNWLVAGAGMTPAQWFSKEENTCTPDDVRRAWLALAEHCPIEVRELPDIIVPRLAATAPAALLAPRRGEPPRVREAWTRGSFTALTRHLHARDQVADHDVQIAPPPGVSDPPASLAADDILRFPRGANAGSCLHRVFELIDFTCDDGWESAIQRGLREFPQGASGAESSLHAAMLRRMLGDVLACPLQENLRLDGIARADRLNELAFTLSSPALAVDELNALLLGAGYLRERLGAHGWRGFLSGAIDLVFRCHGKIYLLDWKSNFLGESSEDYSRAGMEQEMHRHAYHLQHLLYTVALRRYLVVRQPGYDHARDFGGVFYLFVRGVRPQWRLADGSQAGVFFERAPDELITAIDRCLDEASVRSA